MVHGKVGAAVVGRRGTDQRLHSDDHDLLTRIDERLKGLAETCNGLVATLGNKANVAELTTLRVEVAKSQSDFENRIRTLEQFNWKQAGAYALILILIGFGLRFIQ